MRKNKGRWTKFQVCLVSHFTYYLRATLENEVYFPLSRTCLFSWAALWKCVEILSGQYGLLPSGLPAVWSDDPL